MMMMNQSFSSMNPNQQKRYLSREFKKRGLSLQPAALSALMNVLRREEDVGVNTSYRKGKRETKGNNSHYDILQLLLDEIKKRMMNNGNSIHTNSNNITDTNHRHHNGSNYNQNINPNNQSIVTQEILQNVVADLSRDGNDILDEALQLLNAWKMKRLDYNMMKKRWSLVDQSEEVSSTQNGERKDTLNTTGRSVFGQPCDKVNMLLQRYHLIQQRLLRNEMFQNKLSINSTSSSTNMLQNEQHKLTPIEGLLGTTERKTLLGIIVQIEQNQYYLEDPTGSIPIDLSHVRYPMTDGFITEYSIVLLEGHMSTDDGETLIVESIGHPMYETRKDAIQCMGLQNSNIFDAIPNLNELSRLQDEELEHGPDGMFVILSDVHLDDLNVLEKLEKLFRGFDDVEGDDDDGPIPLPVFILMGNFASSYPSTNGSNSTGGGGGGSASGGKASNASTMSHTQFVMSLFDELANIIVKFPRIAQEGRFVLIPSTNDVGIGNILPRPPLPRYFLKGLKSKVKHVHLASNPCRLRYFSKEIVLGRIDVLSKLRRNCILPPREDVDSDDEMDYDNDIDEKMTPTNHRSNDMNRLIQHSITTILNQGHLCPVPLQTTPIYWQYDHALRLYPAPDILVLSESTTKPYSEKYEDDVEVMNPGPFYSDYKFLVIKPCDADEEGDKNKVFVDVEFSQVA